MFLNAKIIFCIQNIGENIKTKVDKEMHLFFLMMINKQISKEDLIQKFQLRIEACQNEQGVYLLQELILKKEHWLLSITSNYINCTCSNHVEGFLCSLKNFNRSLRISICVISWFYFH